MVEWMFYMPMGCGFRVTIDVCTPLHCDGLLDHLGFVQLCVAKLFWHSFTYFSRYKVGYKVSHNLAVGSWLQVTCLLWFHHGGVDVLVMTHFWT